jgi:hypothetical protein
MNTTFNDMISKLKYVLLLSLFASISNAFANVTVTSGGNLNLCVGTTYTTIGNITIQEGAATDFSASGSIQTYEINAPSNFEFNPGNGSVTATGADITFSALTVTSTKITLYYLLNATATTDNFVLSSIQIRATNSSGSQNIVRTGGSAVQAGNNAFGSVHAAVTANQAFVNLSLGSLSTLCSNDVDKVLSGGNPGGGTYSGSFVTGGNTFSPGTAGAGTYTITYTATQNGCVGSATGTITVRSAPSVTFFGLASSYCSADSVNYQLTGFPSGGTFSGSGIVNTSFFYPPAAGVGTNKSITYQYNANGCQTTTTLQTNVKQSPAATTVTLSLAQTNFFNTDDSILIDGNPSYLALNGGTLKVSGNGVATDNAGVSRLYPKVIGQGSSVITRTYTAPNGCSTTGNLSVTVTNSTGGVIGGISDTVCKTANQFTMTVANDNGYYMTYYYNTSIGYVLDNNVLTDSDHTNGIGLFDPKKASIGTYLIYFFGNQNGLTYKFVQVAAPPVVTVTNITPSYCSNIKEFPIQYTKKGYGNGNVSFSGTGVSNGKFDPSSINSFNVANTINYTYSDASGCSSSGSIGTTIYQSPSGVGFTGLSDKYCSSSPPSILNPKPAITPAGAGSFSGVGLDFNDALQPIFNPNIILNTNSASKEYTLTYSYITNDGCRVDSSKKTTVYVVPEVNLNGLNTKYCLGKDTIVLNGSPGSNAGVFSITALAPATTPSDILFNNNRFLISKTIPGTYYLTYTYKDPITQCTSFDVDTTVVNPNPLVYFTGLKSTYCDQDAASDLVAFPPFTSSSSSFTSVPEGSAVAGTKFIPILAKVNKHLVTYTYTDKNGCKSDSTITTVVYNKPIARFSTSSYCENDIVSFRDSSSVLISSLSASSLFNKWVWKVDEKALIRKDLDTTFKAGPHSISYITITDAGCGDTITKNITFGSYPETSFTWDKICNKEDTKFINTTNIIVGKVTNVVWDFGDGNAPVTLQTVNPGDGNTIHKFQNVSDDLASTYTVILKATSNYNCVHSETQKVFILPSQKIFSATPYVNDFNVNNGGWIASSPGDSLLSWVLNSPNKKFIKSTNPAWVTNDTKAFKPNEISYVYSPCFTLDNDITRPMIHIDIWSGTRKDVAGANLQYSIDGTNFLTLGKANESGLNWYNNGTNIVSRPSGVSSLDQDGWTGVDSVGWKNARHIFDNEIGTNKNIRFRISFAASTDTTTDGFAFDNVWIGDRTRLILAEHFTNNSSLNTVYENDTLNKLIAANLLNNEPKDIIKLEYHTAFPGTDQINVRNIPDAGARSLYYGVTQIPYTSVDGSYFNGNTLRINQNMIDTRSLYDPAFEVLLAPSLNSSTNTISGSVTIKSKIPVTNNVTVYISMLERFVNDVTGSNNESSYQWVHAKFLPDAAGTTFAPNWSAQNSQVVNFNWNFGTNYLYNPDKLAIIAFVQDNVTKEIYQAAYKGLGATVTTGVFNPVESTSTVTLYPNPANDLTTVILNGKLAGEYNWVITDELGRTVGQGTLTDGTDGFTINSQSYANGFYTLRISNSNDGVKTQKFVVLH